MENKQSPSKKKSLIHEENFIREIDYDSAAAGSSRTPKKSLFLEILQKGPSYRNSSQKVLVSIKPRTPAIKTLYIAEKSRFHSKKHTEISGTRLAIGDHSSFTSRYSEESSCIIKTIPCIPKLSSNIEENKLSTKTPSSSIVHESSTAVSKYVTSSTSQDVTVYTKNYRSSEKCYMYTQPHVTINIPKLETVTETTKKCPFYNKNISALIVTNTSSKDKISNSVTNIININKRIDWLEQRILKQEMVFRTLDPNIQLSSTDDETDNERVKAFPKAEVPGCSYVEYSHIPETSAFQRYTQQPAPLSPSKATTIQKEHNSEQYGRDFTLYDGITARGRRQCASVPCKRDEMPKIAADRVHRIRHKLNPVRDYRLMDTVHYLAQGEFAPRDDGIKLTPSREAVLSDIIWEDVCRTHWPNTRLGRRLAHPERYGPKSELQRLIDSLLRERVAHVERRRRRHYRIVKLNNRHENCRTVGKTGDIIVASNKNRLEGEEKYVSSDRDTGKAVMTERRYDKHPRTEHRSHDRLKYPESRTQRPFTKEDCAPGPSNAANRSNNKQSTCCYRTSSPSNRRSVNKTQRNRNQEETSDSSVITPKVRPKHPKLVIKKSSGRSKFTSREPNLEHYILLPTLVIRTPSNMKRQKKFNELYHKILNKASIKSAYCNRIYNFILITCPGFIWVQCRCTMYKNNLCYSLTKLSIEQLAFNFKGENTDISPNPNKKNIGLNINITLSESEENLHNKT